MTMKDAELWSNWLLRVILVGISAFAVTYLKDIGTQTASLSNQFLELKYEIKRLAENQMEMNNNFAKQLDKLDERVNQLEKRRKP